MKLPNILTRNSPRPAQSELRSGYADAIIAGLESAAAGKAITAARSAALEIAAGWYGRCLSIAQVENGGAATEALTANVLMMIGRQLCRDGQAVFAIELRRGRIVLLPACDWEVTGGADPASWVYRLDIETPSGTTTRTLPSAGIIHARYAVSPRRPWAGISPLAVASDAARLVGTLDAKLGDELQSPVGSVIPLPPSPGDDDDDVDPNELLRKDIAALKGGVALPETTASGWEQGRANSPAGDWRQNRIGAQVPAELIALQTSAASLVLATLGVSPALAHGQADGASRRESLRQFLHGTLQPLGDLVLPELREKLNAPDLRLNHDRLFAADIRSRGQALKAMIESGIELQEAGEIAGLFPVD